VISDDAFSVNPVESAYAESYSDLPSLTSSQTSVDDSDFKLREWLALRAVAASEFLAQEIAGATIRDFIQSYDGKPDEQILKDQLQEMIGLYGADIRSIGSRAGNPEQVLVGIFLHYQAKFIVESTKRLTLGLPQSTQRLTEIATSSKRLKQSTSLNWTNYDLEAGDSDGLQHLLAMGSPPSKDVFVVHMRSTEPMKMFAKYVQLLTPPTMVARNTSVSLSQRQKPPVY
jgi:hypothetical protein